MKVKDLLNESKETEWSELLTGKQLMDRLSDMKAKRVFNALKNHKWNAEMHQTGGMGQVYFKHKTDSSGHHEIKAASTYRPNEYLHYFISPNGRMWQINHYRLNEKRTKDHGQKTFDLVKQLKDPGE